MSRSYSIYAAVRVFLQPYWVPDALKIKKKTKSTTADTETGTDASEPLIVSDDSDEKVSAVVQAPKPPEHSIKLGGRADPEEYRGIKGIKVLTYPKEIGDPRNLESLPIPQNTWYYHDENVHELLSHFLPDRGFKFKDRSNKARGRLKPLIYPRDAGAFDRTHLIPFGYHGSEADSRLLVGWDSEHNRGPMNTFEQKQKKIKVPFYWYVRIKRRDNGATLTYMTFDARDMRLIDSLELSMRGSFFWSA